jgi:hypothetical protein
MQQDVAITSLDNPYDPFEEFTSWLTYDIQMGYYTCERLASLVIDLPDALTQEENNYFVNEAIDELLKTDCFDKNGKVITYKKVFRNNKKEKVIQQ